MLLRTERCTCLVVIYASRGPPRLGDLWDFALFRRLSRPSSRAEEDLGLVGLCIISTALEVLLDWVTCGTLHYVDGSRGPPRLRSFSTEILVGLCIISTALEVLLDWVTCGTLHYFDGSRGPPRLRSLWDFALFRRLSRSSSTG